MLLNVNGCELPMTQNYVFLIIKVMSPRTPFPVKDSVMQIIVRACVCACVRVCVCVCVVHTSLQSVAERTAQRCTAVPVALWISMNSSSAVLGALMWVT